MRYLVTGGAGFIGSHLVDALVEQRKSVLVLDDFSTGSHDNIAHLLESELVEVVDGSVLDEALVDECVRSVDRCVHLASAVGVNLIMEHPLESLRSNALGAEVVISAVARHGRKLLFASTSEVYGKTCGDNLSESDDRLIGATFTTRWSYAIGKAFGEALAHTYCVERGARIVVARLFNVVGPRQTGAYGMVLPRFVRQALAEEDLTVYGDGTQTRCFTHVLDVVEAMIALSAREDAVGRCFNIGAGTEVPIDELAQKVLEHTGSRSDIAFMPYEEVFGEGFEELGRRVPDVSALRGLTGWEPTRTIDQVVRDVVAHERAAPQVREARERTVPLAG